MFESLDNTWFYTCIKWLESTATNLISIFAWVVFKSKPRWSFLHCTRFKNRMRNGKFVSYKHRDWQRESKQLSPASKIRRAANFSFHIFRYTKEIKMSHDSLLFLKKNCSDIINKYFWNSPSKEMNLFDYLSYFF